MIPDGSTGLLALLPFGIVLVAGAAVLILFVLGKFTGDDLGEITEAVVTIGLGVLVVMIIVRFVCMNIRPVEQFAGTTFMSAIADAETQVCAYRDRVTGFLQNQVGPASQTDPTLLPAAEQKAEAAAGGPLTVCPPTALPDDATLDEAEDRIARMETTLSGLTAPIFQQAYTASNTCESFQSQEDAAARYQDLQQRLTTIQQVLAQQKQQYLDPIDAKQAALQRGELSDCDRAKGASSGASVAGGAAPFGPSPSGSSSG
jgi:hypothetical protein